VENIKDTFKTFAKQGTVYGIGSIVNKAIGFFLIPVYTHLLDPAEFGRFALLSLTINILIIIFSAGLPTAMFRSYYDYKEEDQQNTVISTVTYLCFFFALLLISTGFIFTDIFARIVSLTERKFLIKLMFISAGFEVMNHIPLNVFRAKMKAKLFIVLNISSALVRFLLIIYFVVILKYSLDGLIFGYFLSSIITFILLYSFIFKYINLKIQMSEIKIMLAFGLPLILSGISHFILQSSDSYFLKHYTDIAHVGIYNIAYKFGMISQFILVVPLEKTWNPLMLAVKDKDFAMDFYKKSLTYYTFIGLSIVLFFSIFSRELFLLLTNESYIIGYTIIPFILLTYFAMGFGRIATGVGITLKRKTKYGMIAFTIAAIVNILLNFLLIPLFNIYGAAISTLLSYSLAIIVKYHFSQKLIKISYEFNRISLFFIIAIIIFIPGFFLYFNNIFLNIIIKLLFVLLFPVIIYIVDKKSKNDYNKIKSFLQSKLRSKYGISFSK